MLNIEPLEASHAWACTQCSLLSLCPEGYCWSQKGPLGYSCCLMMSRVRRPASFLGSGPRRPPPAELPPKPCSVYPGCSPTTDSLSILIFQSYSDKLLQSVVAPNNSFLSHSSAGQKSRIKMSAPHQPYRKLFRQHSFLLLCGSRHSRACGRLSAISPLGLSVS